MRIKIQIILTNSQQVMRCLKDLLVVRLELEINRTLMDLCRSIRTPKELPVTKELQILDTLLKHHLMGRKATVIDL